MAVTRMLARVRDGLEEVLETRRAPDDVIDFDASLEFVQQHGDEDEGTSCTSVPVVNIWVALMCPELGIQAKSTVQLMVPVALLETHEEVASVANSVWDSLQSNRVLNALGVDDTDHPDGQ